MTRRCIAFSSYTGNRCTEPVGASERCQSHCVCEQHDESRLWQAGGLRDPRVDAVRQQMAENQRWIHVNHLMQELEALNTEGARIVIKELLWTTF
jgi:hypothetical protein